MVDLLLHSAVYGGAFGAVCWLSLLLLPWRPISTDEQIEPDPSQQLCQDLSDITVLIPARNEAPYIQQTLDGLEMQGKGLQVIVIDDQSTDETAQLAHQKGAHVIAGTTPPTGWSGKLWALEQGLQHVNTPYTLLLDADITLSQGIVATLKSKALTENRSMVSLMAAPPMDTIVECMLMPAFIFFFKLLYPFGLTNKPDSRMAAAAGGCILAETMALRSAGAFSSLHNALIDDCTLATRIKHSGKNIWLGLSLAARSHRSYHGLGPIWEMVARTAYTQLNYSLILLLLCTLIMLSMFWLAPFAFLLLHDPKTYMISLIACAAMYYAYKPTLIYYRRSPLWTFVLPFTGALYLAMTWTSAIRYWRGERARWKDRHYESKTDH
jgi:hopene-associated glycosyltransferase HpnB